MKTAKITYSRPPTICKILTNYKTISQDKNKNMINNGGCSHACGRCALCGNFKIFESMVTTTDHIKTKNGKLFKLKQQLDCRDYGIYAAQCTTCQEIYVGQTVTTFSKRWTAHRSTWKKIVNKNLAKIDLITDETALYHHYQIYIYKMETYVCLSVCLFVCLFVRAQLKVWCQ